MKKGFKLAAMALVAAAMCVCLAACGGGGDAGNGGGGVDVKTEGAANIDPVELATGWGAGDIWWKNGEAGTEGFSFYGSSSHLYAVNWYVEDPEMEAELGDADAEGMNLKVELLDGTQLDLVFDTHVAAYDLASGTWFIREDEGALIKALAGNTYVAENRSLVFNDDGTYEETYKGDTRTGTWFVGGTASITMVEDGSDYRTDYNFVTVADGKVTEIDGNGLYTLQA